MKALVKHHSETTLQITCPQTSTCETKNDIQRVNNSKPKKRYDKRKKQTISSSESENSDNDSISSYEMRKRSFLDDDNSFVHHTRKDDISEEESSENESPPLKESLETEIEKHLIDIYNKNFSNSFTHVLMSSLLSLRRIISIIMFIFAFKMF
jgi:magnesium-transporting ATPase (P-type)